MIYYLVNYCTGGLSYLANSPFSLALHTNDFYQFRHINQILPSPVTETQVSTNGGRREPVSSELKELAAHREEAFDSCRSSCCIC